MHNTLAVYSDSHKGQFPHFDAEPPLNRAAYLIPQLHDAGLTSPSMTLTCPANGQKP